MTDHSINLDAQFLSQLARQLSDSDPRYSDSFDWPRISSRLRVIARHIESLDERAARAETLFVSKSNFPSEAARQLQLVEQAEGATLLRRFEMGARALPPKAPQKDLSGVNFADLFPAPTGRKHKKRK
ncbi:hypothetical protein M0Q28_06180 [Patescibacteria group bacterium]|jgi:hypothetical protein|nr:hypothetical protein [Patescibacteria group bacterium]